MTSHITHADKNDIILITVRKTDNTKLCNMDNVYASQWILIVIRKASFIQSACSCERDIANECGHRKSRPEFTLTEEKITVAFAIPWISLHHSCDTLHVKIQNKGD